MHRYLYFVLKIFILISFLQQCEQDKEGFKDPFKDLSEEDIMRLVQFYNIVTPKCGADVAIAKKIASSSFDNVEVVYSYSGDRPVTICGMDEGSAEITIQKSGRYKVGSVKSGYYKLQCGTSTLTYESYLSVFLNRSNLNPVYGSDETGSFNIFDANAGDKFKIRLVQESKGVYCENSRGGIAGTQIENSAATGILQKF
ncbi:hypothetical protein [Leptospira alexanderi]|uniref:hypothetical protein n=1 Tax=Leptospira alexanderi TaxID=100053 RepID=UPI00099139AC|nr:hypothetical protein [Leptospira alexanderi]